MCPVEKPNITVNWVFLVWPRNARVQGVSTQFQTPTKYVRTVMHRYILWLNHIKNFRFFSLLLLLFVFKQVNLYYFGVIFVIGTQSKKKLKISSNITWRCDQRKEVTWRSQISREGAISTGRTLSAWLLTHSLNVTVTLSVRFHKFYADFTYKKGGSKWKRHTTRH